jgi:hypothetical protein
MAGIPSEHARDVREALRSVASDPDLGPATLSDPAALSNLLKDLLPDAPREKNLLVAAAEAGLAAMMLDHVGQGIDARSAIRLAAASFGTNTLYSGDVCQWVARELAIALNLDPGLADERTELPAEGSKPTAPVAGTPAAAEPAFPTAPVPVPAAATAPDPVLAGAARDPVPAAPTAPAPAPTAAAAPLARAELTAAQGFTTTEGPEPGAAESSREAARPRRLSAGAMLVLAGVIVAAAGYVLPVFYTPHYRDYGINELTRHIGQGGKISLAVAAVCTAIIVFGPRRKEWLMAASAGACAAGLLMSYTFWHVYGIWVAGFHDSVRPGLIAGLVGAALLAVAGAIVFFMSLARNKADSGLVSRGPR